MDIEPDMPPADAATESLLVGLYDAIDRRDIDAVLAFFCPDARIPDSLENVTVTGHDQIRAYYQRQFAAIQVNSLLLRTHVLADHRVEAHLHVQVRGAQGGAWGEGAVKAIYQLVDGKIMEMVVGETSGI